MEFLQRASLRIIQCLLFVSFLIGCSVKESKRAYPEAGEPEPNRKEPLLKTPQVAVNTAVVDAILVHCDPGGECTIQIKRLLGSGAGAPVIAAGDSIQVFLDDSAQAANSEIDKLLRSQDETTLTLKYIQALRFETTPSTSWRIVDIAQK